MSSGAILTPLCLLLMPLVGTARVRGLGAVRITDAAGAVVDLHGTTQGQRLAVLGRGPGRDRAIGLGGGGSRR